MLPLEKLTDHTRFARIDTFGYLPLTLKIKTRDFLRLVKPFTLISLTVSTSSTFETALFHPYKYRPWGGCLVHTLGEKIYAGGVYTEVFWSSGTHNPLAAEESLSQALGCTLISFTDC